MVELQQRALAHLKSTIPASERASAAMAPALEAAMSGLDAVVSQLRLDGLVETSSMPPSLLASDPFPSLSSSSAGNIAAPT